MGNQPGQEFEDGSVYRERHADVSQSGELARTPAGRELVEKHREFERQLEALRGKSAQSIVPPVPMHGPQAPAEDEDATPDDAAKQKLQLSPEQTEIAAKAAAEAVMRLCPTGTEAEKRRALASIRNTREALSEMPPFELPFGRKRGRKSRGVEEDPDEHLETLDEDSPTDEVKTLSTLEEGPFNSSWNFPVRRNRVLCGVSCEQLRRPCEMLGYPGPPCCSDTTSSFAVGYEEPEDIRRQAMAAAASSRHGTMTLPPAIPEEATTEAGAQHASLMSTMHHNVQVAENSTHQGPPDLTPSLQSFGARSDGQLEILHNDPMNMLPGLVRTLSSSSAPGLGLRPQPRISSFREARGSLSSSARALPPGMPLAVALSKPLVRQASNSSSWSAPGQLGAPPPVAMRQPPPPRSPSGASLPTPARSPANSPRGHYPGPYVAGRVQSFSSSPQQSFAQHSTFTQHSFVVMPMSA